MNFLSKHRNLPHPLFNFRTSWSQSSLNDTRKTGHAKPVLLLLCRKSRMSWLFRAWEKLTKINITLSADFSGFPTGPKTTPIQTSQRVTVAQYWHTHPLSLINTCWWFDKCACTWHSRKYKVWKEHFVRQNRWPGVRQIQLLSAGCSFQPLKCCCKWKDEALHEAMLEWIEGWLLTNGASCWHYNGVVRT